MITPSDRSPLIRLASGLPKGSAERRTLLAALKKLAAVADDTLARADLVTGALTKDKTADRGPVYQAMQNGIGGLLEEFNTFAKDMFAQYEVGDLKGLREAELAEEDAEKLAALDKRFKAYGPIAPKLVDLLGQIGEADDYQVLSNSRDERMREAVMAGAAKGIHGMVETMPSGRRQVTDIGRGGIQTPGSHGVDAEDLAQVMLAGGLMMPGMIFDMKMSDKTDVGGGIKVRGKFKERKKPWCPAGCSIYTIAGAARGALVRPGKNYARTVAMNAAVDWKRSVHVELEYILTPADEQEGADTGAINMGGKVSLEALLGADLIDGVTVSKQMTLARYYIKKVRQAMKRSLPKGNQAAIWEAVAEMITQKKNPWKGQGRGGEFALDYTTVIPFLEDTRDGQAILANNDVQPGDITKNNIQRDWVRVRAKMQKALAQLSDDELLAAVHLSLAEGGMVDDVPAYIRKIKEDKDLYQTYIADMKKYGSRTITAAQRSAMIRLAASLPKGSPERRAILAGCEKLKVPAMRENCEKSKKDGVQPGKGKAKSDKKKDDGKMPAELLEKFKAKKKAGEKKEAAGKKMKFTFKEHTDLPTVAKGKLEMTFWKKGEGITAEIVSEDARNYTVKDHRGEQYLISKKSVTVKTAGKGKLPDALKEHQFTSEDNPNPKGNDKDGDGKSGEKKPFESKKAALIRLAATLPVGSQERKTLIRMAAGA